MMHCKHLRREHVQLVAPVASKVPLVPPVELVDKVPLVLVRTKWGFWSYYPQVCVPIIFT